MKPKILYILYIIILLSSCNNKSDNINSIFGNDTISDSLNTDFSTEELQGMMLGVEWPVMHPNDPKHGVNKKGDKECCNGIEKTKGIVYVETESEKRYYSKDSLPKKGFLVIYENGDFKCCGPIENMVEIP